MNVATRLTSLLVCTALFAAPACSRDAKTELEAWKANACSCTEHSCATKQRGEFWRLVQEFRDDTPSKAEARKLGLLIDEGQACLESMSVDIYASN
tara:strand:+ start:118602 stop:118889 length:288 start_codon:yes stop_codon:yes gene_type:complete